MCARSEADRRNEIDVVGVLLKGKSFRKGGMLFDICTMLKEADLRSRRADVLVLRM